jgi:hypothetical protein
VQGKLEKEERDIALDMMNFANKSSERQGTSKSLTAGQQKTHAHGNSARQETHTTAPLSPTAAQRFAQAVWGPLAGLLVNLMLVVIKVMAGLASGSVALLAGAGHSGWEKGSLASYSGRCTR